MIIYFLWILNIDIQCYYAIFCENGDGGVKILELGFGDRCEGIVMKM